MSTRLHKLSSPICWQQTTTSGTACCRWDLQAMSPQPSVLATAMTKG